MLGDTEAFGCLQEALAVRQATGDPGGETQTAIALTVAHYNALVTQLRRPYPSDAPRMPLPAGRLLFVRQKHWNYGKVTAALTPGEPHP
jgi:hypothetical protein